MSDPISQNGPAPLRSPFVETPPGKAARVQGPTTPRVGAMPKEPLGPVRPIASRQVMDVSDSDATLVKLLTWPDKLDARAFMTPILKEAMRLHDEGKLEEIVHLLKQRVKGDRTLIEQCKSLVDHSPTQGKETLRRSLDEAFQELPAKTTTHAQAGPLPKRMPPPLESFIQRPASDNHEPDRPIEANAPQGDPLADIPDPPAIQPSFPEYDFGPLDSAAPNTARQPIPSDAKPLTNAPRRALVSKQAAGELAVFLEKAYSKANDDRAMGITGFIRNAVIDRRHLSQPEEPEYFATEWANAVFPADGTADDLARALVAMDTHIPKQDPLRAPMLASIASRVVACEASQRIALHPMKDVAQSTLLAFNEAHRERVPKLESHFQPGIPEGLQLDPDET